ncbi:MAG: hypothetical protein B5766_11995 [Candidatus Lumbricidophila eiseniae]|uniref:Uncharacterized protein n=1 Tax=Candidatus Lumbricidiphila eiseniae TaxID=1969409 RepID=A0A2A6FNU1_9MICO|nr:MAG: hypothetical protein B5766_11995 [Candidatus Lumbricidophila eiseniae]
MLLPLVSPAPVAGNDINMPLVVTGMPPSSLKLTNTATLTHVEFFKNDMTIFLRVSDLFH